MLDCILVYTYKFNKHKVLQKCKARLVVRGDQEIRSLHKDTYAATLARKSLRVLMAIAACFDLELLQYNAVNAFINADLNEEKFIKLPWDYREQGKVLSLKKALYSPRKSPVLWQRELTKTLESLGFTPVHHKPCYFTNNGILICFYVDDIIIAFQKSKEQTVHQFIEQLKARYKLTGGPKLQWFLGMEVIRDRQKHKLWLSQASYINKIAHLAKSTPLHTTPMGTEELLPRSKTEMAFPLRINIYQRKVSSILYTAIITRPDITFAASRLSQLPINPSKKHQRAADRVLLYLNRTQGYALEFGGGDNFVDDFVVASNASFADNTRDQKSSQGYVTNLFGSIIGWRASKQSSVSTSTTEMICSEYPACSRYGTNNCTAFCLLYAMSCAACSPRRAPHALAPGRLHGQQASIHAVDYYSEAKEPHREPERCITRHTESYRPSLQGVSGHQNQH